MKRSSFVLASLAALVTAGSASAQVPAAYAWPPTTTANPPSLSPPRSRPDTWQGSLGFRILRIHDPGFDPFSTNDALTQISLAASRTVIRQDRLALAVGLGLEHGSASADARGAPSDLGLLHVSLFVEGRYIAHPRIYGFVRAAPGLAKISASVHESSAPARPNGTVPELSDGFTVPSLEGSLGAAYCLTSASRQVGAWLMAQGGYTWAASHSLLLRPDVGGNASQVQPLNLGTLSPSGPFLSFSFALSL